jgi:hypothetical protein
MKRWMGMCLCWPILAMAGEGAAKADMGPSLAGNWELIGAYREHRDGTRSEDYGSQPRGTLYMGADGRYALQIYHSTRPPFEGDFRQGAAEEYRRLLLAMSTHYGHYRIEGDTLLFHITAAANPQWDGSSQRRPFTLRGAVLEWRVPPRPDGEVPISVWRRLP